MPANDKTYQREYIREYRKNPTKRAEDNSRKRARYDMEKKGKVKKGDGKEVDHKNSNALDNTPSNLQIITRALNRKKGMQKANKKMGRGI